MSENEDTLDLLPGGDQRDDPSADDAGFVFNGIRRQKSKDYIEALPDKVELVENNTKVKYNNLRDGNDYHKVPVNELHDLLVDAVKCEETQSKVCTFLLESVKNHAKQFMQKDKINTPSCTLSKHLSISENGIEVEVSSLLTQLLQNAADLKFEQLKKGYIEVRITDTDGKIDKQNINANNITNVQALLRSSCGCHEMLPKGMERNSLLGCLTSGYHPNGLVRKNTQRWE